MKIKTFIKESLNGHQVSFTIGCQTFSLQEQESEIGMTSLQYAQWYKKQLDIAFSKLEK